MQQLQAAQRGELINETMNNEKRSGTSQETVRKNKLAIYIVCNF